MKIAPTGKYKKFRLALCCIALLSAVTYAFALPEIFIRQYSPKEGDIVFQSLPLFSDLVRAIEGASGSIYSHCGVVINVKGKWYVKEALGDVHNTELYAWLKRGRGYRVDVYRLKEQYSGTVQPFIAALNKYNYRLYDIRYKLEDEELYCSELVYRAYKDATGQELGKLVKLGDMNWQPYKSTIEKYEQGPVPLERKMITPKNLSEAEQLYHVQSIGV